MKKRGRPSKKDNLLKQAKEFIKEGEKILSTEELEELEKKFSVKNNEEDDILDEDIEKDDEIDEDFDEEDESIDESDNNFDKDNEEPDFQKRSEYSYNEQKQRFSSDYDINLEWNEREDVGDDEEEDDDEIIDKDREEADNSDIDIDIIHPYLTLLQGANVLLTKFIKKDLKFDDDEMEYLNPLFWRAFPDVTDKMNPKTLLFLTLVQVYASKLLL